MPPPTSQKTTLIKQRLLDGLRRLQATGLDLPLVPLNGNKQPLGDEWQKRPFSAAQLIESISNGGVTVPIKGEAKTFQPQGFGVITGRPLTKDGKQYYLMALDQDGASAIEKIEELSGGDSLPKTVAFTSGREGRSQYLFLVPAQRAESLRTRKIKAEVKGEQVELRFQNAQSVLPPSVHPTTGEYRWVKGQAIDETEIALAPDWAIEQMQSIGSRESGVGSREKYSSPITTKNSRPLDWSDKDRALSYLDALAPNRADDYDEWLKVGMALHSVEDSLLNEWDKWSQQSAKYQPGDCERKWRSFSERDGITLGTLGHLAKEDGWQSPFKSRNEPMKQQDNPETYRVGDRVKLSFVPSVITNLTVGTQATVVEPPRKVAKSERVWLRLDNGDLIDWDLEYLEKVPASERGLKSTSPEQSLNEKGSSQEGQLVANKTDNGRAATEPKTANETVIAQCKYPVAAYKSKNGTRLNAVFTTKEGKNLLVVGNKGDKVLESVEKGQFYQLAVDSQGLARLLEKVQAPQMATTLAPQSVPEQQPPSQSVKPAPAVPPPSTPNKQLATSSSEGVTSSPERVPAATSPAKSPQAKSPSSEAQPANSPNAPTLNSAVAPLGTEAIPSAQAEEQQKQLSATRFIQKQAAAIASSNPEVSQALQQLANARLSQLGGMDSQLSAKVDQLLESAQPDQFSASRLNQALKRIGAEAQVFELVNKLNGATPTIAPQSSPGSQQLTADAKPTVLETPRERKLSQQTAPSPQAQILQSALNQVKAIDERAKNLESQVRDLRLALVEPEASKQQADKEAKTKPTVAVGQREQKELIMAENSTVTSHQNSSNSRTMIPVSETEESIGNRLKGLSQHPVVEPNKRGNHWLINEGENTFLIPNNNLRVNQHNFKTLEALFECQGYQPEQNSSFQVIQPAQVAALDGKSWQVVAPGVLQFSLQKTQAQQVAVEPNPSASQENQSSLAEPSVAAIGESKTPQAEVQSTELLPDAQPKNRQVQSPLPTEPSQPLQEPSRPQTEAQASSPSQESVNNSDSP